MIDYIVSCYFGPRRLLITSNCYKNDKLFFLKAHVEMINKFKSDQIHNVIFTLNSDDPTDVELMDEFIKTVKCRVPVKYIIQPNIGFSYSAWEKAIIKYIDDPVDHYFLIEDDYVPNIDHFYNYFLSKMNSPYVGYVCELVFENHPAGPNGIIRADICREIFNEKGVIFDVNRNAKIYHDGENNQRYYLNFLLDRGYIIKDIADLAKIERLDNWSRLKTYGNINRFRVTKPLYKLDGIIL